MLIKSRMAAKYHHFSRFPKHMLRTFHVPQRKGLDWSTTFTLLMYLISVVHEADTRPKAGVDYGHERAPLYPKLITEKQ